MKQVEEMEQRSKERRAVRRTVPQPFSFSERSERRTVGMSETASEAGGDTPRDHAGAFGENVGARKSFHARDVPRSMSEPRWEMMRVREAERRERVAQEALRLAQRSKLPPRMQKHKETARARKAAEAERIQAELDAELTLKPRITEGVPDFDRLHMNFERTQVRLLSSHSLLRIRSVPRLVVQSPMPCIA